MNNAFVFLEFVVKFFNVVQMYDNLLFEFTLKLFLFHEPIYLVKKIVLIGESII